MENQQISVVVKVFDVIQRRKALILLGVWLGLCGGLAVYLMQPKVYQGTSLLSFQTQKVSPAAMSPELDSSVKDTVSTLSQIVASRTNLEKIILSENLYKEERDLLPMEDVVVGMRSHINIIPPRQGDTFQIVFTGQDPQKVARVTNALAAKFIEENLQYREERATDTSVYTKDELNLAKEMLDAKEAVMRDYKLKYYNEMADQRESNMARLIALQNQYQSRLDSQQNLERTRVLVNDQISLRKEFLVNKAKEDQLEAAGLAGEAESAADYLTKLRQQLEFLKTKYTDQHPRIKILQRKIEQLEEIDQRSGQSGHNKGSVAGGGDGDNYDKTLSDLELQRKEIDLNVEKIKKEMVDIQDKISQYEGWVAAAPVREAEWSALTREYGELRRHYDLLVAQNLQANSALNLERKQKGSQFKIEDPAQVPLKPIAPDFLKIMGVALLLGLGLGGGCAFLLEKADGSFRFPEEFESDFNLEVICSVPHLPLGGELVKNRIIVAVSVIFFILAYSSLGVVAAYLWRHGRIIL